MEWKNNKLIGIAGAIIVFLSLLIIAATFLRYFYSQKQSQENYEKWKDKLIYDDQGRIVGANIDGKH